MDVEVLAILVLCGVATVALMYYGYSFLPRKLEQRTRESTKAFSLAVELRYPSREGTSARVVELCQLLGQHAGLSSRELYSLEMAAWLRDIGLCSLPYRLVNSTPSFQWTPAELATYERHPEVSGAMLELVPSLRRLAQIVRCHHAKFDGTDGPFFPSGTDIPIEARILAIVTAYVRLERLQGGLLAREGLRDGVGSLYDPELVRLFLTVLTSSRVGESAEPIAV